MTVEPTESDGMNANVIRKRFAEMFWSTLNWENLSLEVRTEIIMELRSYFNYLSKRHIIEMTSSSILGYPPYLQHSELKLELQFFEKLVLFDFHLQDFCFNLATHTLWECGLVNLSSFELSELLNTAIHNIEEIEKIFTRRKELSLVYLADSRDEWCRTQFDQLVFKKELAEFRIDANANLQSLHDFYTLDIEAMRRALYEKRKIVQKYSQKEQKSIRNPIEVLQKSIDLWELLEEEAESVNNSNERISAVDLFQKASRQPSLFPGCIYFRDLLPDDRITMICGCSTRCATELFPKGASEDDQIEFLTCPQLKQFEFLECHQIFERAFRLLHFWERIDLHKYTHLYLIEKLLFDMRRSPDHGFHFLYVDEDDSINSLIVCHRKTRDNFVRAGLLIGLDSSSENTFFSQQFKLGHYTDECFFRVIGLLYIKFEELVILLQTMIDFIRRLPKYPAEIEESQLKDYQSEMEKLIEDFWTNHKIIC